MAERVARRAIWLPKHIVYTIDKMSDGRIIFEKFRGSEDLQTCIVHSGETSEPVSGSMEEEIEIEQILKKLSFPSALL